MLDLLDNITDNVFILIGNRYNKKSRLRKKTLGDFSKMREFRQSRLGTLKKVNFRIDLLGKGI